MGVRKKPSLNQLLPLWAFYISIWPASSICFSSQSTNGVKDAMDNERVQMQNALYRIQESAQSAAEHGLQANTANLRERRVANVISRSLSETLTSLMIECRHAGRSACCTCTIWRPGLCHWPTRSPETQIRVPEATLSPGRSSDRTPGTTHSWSSHPTSY